MPRSATGEGEQRPRLSHVPEYASSTGGEAIELCEMAGLFLDDWQKFVLTHALGEREDKKWAAFEVGLTVPRQNGKGGILEARELAGLFLLKEPLIIHSAHEFATSLEAFRRLEALIQNTPDLHRRVKPRGYKHSHGEEGIELRNGQRVLFKTRTKGGGRGFTCDCLIYDEDMILAEAAHGATLPTLSARPNPQVWYTGSAVDQTVHEHGVVKSRLRDRALRGNDPSLAYFEWSVEGDDPDKVSDTDVSDVGAWSRANPALGIRISAEHVGRELRSMDSRRFAVERLNVGDWPDPEGEGVQLVPNWRELADPHSEVVGDLAFAFDVSPDRSSAAIGVAGYRADHLFHIEVVDHRPGTGWITDRLVGLVEKHGSAAVTCDEKGPAGALIRPLANRGVKVESTNAGEYAQACGHFFDACGVEGGDEPELRHLGTTELAKALRGARQRPLGDAWAWSRKSSSVDITPLVACTLALWRANEITPSTDLEETPLRDVPGSQTVVRRGDLTLVGDRYADRDRRDLGPVRGR